MLMRMNLTHADLDIILAGLCAPKRLKVLELGFAENLTHLPDLSALSGLKSLGLYGCTSLRELPDVSRCAIFANSQSRATSTTLRLSSRVQAIRRQMVTRAGRALRTTGFNTREERCCPRRRSDTVR